MCAKPAVSDKPQHAAKWELPDSNELAQTKGLAGRIGIAKLSTKEKREIVESLDALLNLIFESRLPDLTAQQAESLDSLTASSQS